jgi:hypothetical protein
MIYFLSQMAGKEKREVARSLVVSVKKNSSDQPVAVSVADQGGTRSSQCCQTSRAECFFFVKKLN